MEEKTLPNIFRHKLQHTYTHTNKKRVLPQLICAWLSVVFSSFLCLGVFRFLLFARLFVAVYVAYYYLLGSLLLMFFVFFIL